MIILKTGTDTQTIRVIPRSYSTDIILRLRDESTNEVIDYTLQFNYWDTTAIEWQLANFSWNEGSVYVDKGYLVIANEYDLVENRFYELTIISNSEVVYKDKIFCTNQTISEYSVNNGQYVTENSYDNDFIII